MIPTQQAEGGIIEKRAFFRNNRILSFMDIIEDINVYSKGLDIVWNTIKKRGVIKLKQDDGLIKELCSITEDKGVAIFSFSGRIQEINENRNLLYKKLKNVKGLSWKNLEKIESKKDIRKARFRNYKGVIEGDEIREKTTGIPLNKIFNHVSLNVEWDHLNKKGILCCNDILSGKKLDLCSILEEDNGVLKLTVDSGFVKQKEDLLNMVFDIIDEA